MQIGPKYKICKRLGSSVFEKCQTQKFQLSEARTSKQVSGKRRSRGLSDFGRQVLEKQKARFTYGITEGQLARYAKSVNVHAQTKPDEQLIGMLELRLDNVVYRAGLAPTRRMARQLVTHGHICVNGRRMNVPSHALRVGDTVSVRKESARKGPFAELAENGSAPNWLSVNRADLSVVVSGIPADTETNFDVAAVLEFYSR